MYFLHRKIAETEKDNSAVEGAHKTEQRAEDIYHYMKSVSYTHLQGKHRPERYRYEVSASLSGRKDVYKRQGFPVSSTAKVMYCRMLDAMLSNGQEDENGILFACFPCLLSTSRCV